MASEEKRKLLIADDNRISREQLEEMLSVKYDVLVARDGEKAIEYIEKYHDDIAIVLLDVIMPKKDGFSVLAYMNSKEYIIYIPVIIITSEYSEINMIKANRLGAVDYIMKPFSLGLVSFRIESTIALYDKLRLMMERITEWADEENGVNTLTGLVTGEAFFQKAHRFVALSDEVTALVAIDIEHFKLLNDTYGRSRGDEVLKDMAEQLRNFENTYGCVCGYLGGDDFCMVMEHDPELERSLITRLVNRTKNMRLGAGILPVFGVYVIEPTDDDNIQSMYDKACIAASHCLGNYRERLCVYERSMMDEIMEESDQLEAALEGLRNDEFTFFLQPQCDMKTGKIVGAEALVRWIHDGELIAPYRFVPVMEKNDVVSDLDFKVWEEVCKWLRSWIDRGNVPVPVSINVSRLDIYNFDLPAVITELTNTYDLDPRLLKVEITESSYVEEFGDVNDAVDTLQDMGFRIFMDDFGSGYSSLNMLTNVNVDVLKIDMLFLDLDEGNRKGLDILESVVKMAKLLRLPVVVEGVETEEQLSFLQQLNCDYAQGYYFYKPMPVEDFEKLISEKGMVEPNANFSKFDLTDERAIKIDVTQKEVQDTLFEDFKAIYLMDSEDDYILALKLSDDIKDITGYSVIRWSEEFSGVLREIVDGEFIDDILPVCSREYIKNTFEDLKDERRILYRQKDLSWCIMSLHPLRMNEGKTVVALLCIRDATDIRDAIKRMENE